MTQNDWPTPDQAKKLRAQRAPLKLIRALGLLPHTRQSLTNFDFTDRYGVFVDIVQRRSKRLARRSSAI